MMPSAAPLAGGSKTKQGYSGGGCGGTGASAGLLPPDQGLKCPRCSSPNTKFCYYNNYSLTQPRHFCKSCRRYWTKGGALRSVPVGGGCRKGKGSKTSSSSSSSSSSLLISPSPASFSHIPLETLTSVIPVLEPSAAAAAAPSTANLRFLAQASMDLHIHQNYSTIASSIESLSSMNQDLHWRLQQQRLVTLLGSEEAQKQGEVFAVEGGCGGKGETFGDRSSAANGYRKSSAEASETAWFLDGSFAAMGNEAHMSAGNGAGDWNGIRDWSDVQQQFTVLP